MVFLSEKDGITITYRLLFPVSLIFDPFIIVQNCEIITVMSTIFFTLLETGYRPETAKTWFEIKPVCGTCNLLNKRSSWIGLLLSPSVCPSVILSCQWNFFYIPRGSKNILLLILNDIVKDIFHFK